MTTIVLVRHAENDYVRSGRLAGWTPGVHLNEEGKRQATTLGERMADAKIDVFYSSPLERAVETAQAILGHYPGKELCLDDGIGEAHYGEWTGETLRKLSRTRLWEVVQRTPSQARFPGGESLQEMQNRAVATIERIAAENPHLTVVAVSHGDVIKSIVAHYAGMHLDMFQRLVIAPASISIIHLGGHGPAVVRVNDTHHYDWPKAQSGH